MTAAVDIGAVATARVASGAVPPGAVHRVDRGPPLRLGATPVEVLPSGARVYEGTAAWGDVVKRYPDLRPPRVEYAPADEMMSPEALRSMEGLVFTGGPRRRDWDGTVTLPADHPPDLLTPATVGDAIEGAVLRAWRHDAPGDPPALRVRVVVHTAAAQRLLETGICELSLGFACAEDWTPGVSPGGERYDVVQRRHRYNHLNLVDAARSRTPDGRPARLDRDAEAVRAAETSSYSPDASDPMADTNNTAPADQALSVASTAAAAATDTGAARRDACGPGMRRDAVLSPDDATLLKQMSPEGQAIVMAAMGAADGAVAAIEQAGVATEEAGEEAGEALSAAADMPEGESSGAVDIAAVMSELAALRDMITSLKPTGDAAPMTMDAASAAPAMSAASPTDAPRKDNMKTIDADKIIRDASAAAAAAAVQALNQSAVMVAAVRKDGYDVHTTEQAATKMLEVVVAQLPALKADAEAAVREHRLDSLGRMYDAAEKVRRDRLIGEQATAVAAAHRADSLHPYGGGIVDRTGLSGAEATSPAPAFRLPTPRGTATSAPR